MNQEIMELKLKGYCCSQILLELGLQHLGKESEELISAAAGLCDGVRMGKVCGILSAAVCLLYLADAEAAADGGVEELIEWFEDAFGETECEALIAGKPMNKIEKCPMMLEATFQKVQEILEWD